MLTSVHAFASDPTRRLFMLIFPVLVTGSALILYAIRAPRLADEPGQAFAPVSRESLLLANNLLLGAHGHGAAGHDTRCWSMRWAGASSR